MWTRAPSPLRPVYNCFCFYTITHYHSLIHDGWVQDRKGALVENDNEEADIQVQLTFGFLREHSISLESVYQDRSEGNKTTNKHYYLVVKC